MLKRWYAIYTTGNLPAGEVAGPHLDFLSRWLLITRFCVMPMTLFAGLIGGLLALWKRLPLDWFAWLLVLVGLLLAHMTNNMLNDWLDWRQGLDTADYPRRNYAPHPLADHLVSESHLLGVSFLFIVIDFFLALYLSWLHGWLVFGFGALGLLLSLGYVAPPLSLKRRGLGELTVLVVWGPVMIGGTFLAITGTLPGWVIWASLPYGLLVTSVLLGKHVDKLEFDLRKDIHTLPVLMGERMGLRLLRWSLAGFFILVALEVVFGVLPATCMLIALAVPRLYAVDKVCQHPKPYQRPPEIPIWPLWFAAASFLVVRLAGACLLLGLLLSIWLPVTL